MNYKIGKFGLIKESSTFFDGKKPIGWKVYIVDDGRGGTGGYYILFISPNLNTCNFRGKIEYKYNIWSLNEQELEANLSDFVIEWLEE